METYQGSGGPPQGGGTTEAVRRQATNVGQSAASAAGGVAETARERGGEVVAEAGQQARDLAQEARMRMREQAGAQRDRVASGLRALGDELESMAGRGGESGVATDVARQIAGRTRSVAGYLESREPGDLVEELRGYARRRPGTFLLGAAAAGVLVGRLTKAVRAGTGSSGVTADEGGAAGAPMAEAAGAAYAEAVPEYGNAGDMTPPPADPPPATTPWGREDAAYDLAGEGPGRGGAP